MRRDFKAVHRGWRAYLQGDPTLASLAPGGVWHRVVPQGVRGVRIVWRVQFTEDHLTHDHAGYLRVVYSVMAVDQSDSDAAAVRAADRLLELGTNRPNAAEGREAFPVDGLTVIRMELYPDNPDIQEVVEDGDRVWQYRGSIIDVLAAGTV